MHYNILKSLPRMHYAKLAKPSETFIKTNRLINRLIVSSNLTDCGARADWRFILDYRVTYAHTHTHWHLQRNYNNGQTVQQLLLF